MGALVVGDWPVVGPLPVRAADVVTAPSFEHFFTEQYGPLARYVHALVRDRDVAEEIAQEAFTLVLAAWSRVREPRPYAYRVATHLVTARWRRETRDRARSRSLEVLTPLTQGDSGEAQAVRDAVERLPARQRDLVLLHYYGGLDLAACATALRRPLGTVKRQLSEARAVLRAGLEQP